MWQLLQLHVHLTQKDPENMPLPQFNRSRFFGSWAALIYLEDSLLIQRDWDVRWGKITAVWVLNSWWTLIDSWGWSTFIEQTVEKKRKRKRWWHDDLELSCHIPGLAWMILHWQLQLHKQSVPKKSPCTFFLLYLIFFKIELTFFFFAKFTNHLKITLIYWFNSLRLQLFFILIRVVLE